MKVSKHFWPLQPRPHTRHGTTRQDTALRPPSSLKGFRPSLPSRPGVIRRGYEVEGRGPSQLVGRQLWFDAGALWKLAESGTMQANKKLSSQKFSSNFQKIWMRFLTERTKASEGAGKAARQTSAVLYFWLFSGGLALACICFVGPFCIFGITSCTQKLSESAFCEELGIGGNEQSVPGIWEDAGPPPRPDVRLKMCLLNIFWQVFNFVNVFTPRELLGWSRRRTQLGPQRKGNLLFYSRLDYGRWAAAPATGSNGVKDLAPTIFHSHNFAEAETFQLKRCG